MSTRLVKLFFKAFYCGNVCNCFISVSLFQFLHLLSFNTDNLVFFAPSWVSPSMCFSEDLNKVNEYYFVKQ